MVRGFNQFERGNKMTIIIILAVLIILSWGYLFYEIKNAPEYFEDEAGLHLIKYHKESCPIDTPVICGCKDECRFCMEFKCSPK
jgi:hypothetical protein